MRIGDFWNIPALAVLAAIISMAVTPSARAEDCAHCLPDPSKKVFSVIDTLSLNVAKPVMLSAHIDVPPPVEKTSFLSKWFESLGYKMPDSWNSTGKILYINENSNYFATVDYTANGEKNKAKGADITLADIINNTLDNIQGTGEVNIFKGYEVFRRNVRPVLWLRHKDRSAPKEDPISLSLLQGHLIRIDKAMFETPRFTVGLKGGLLFERQSRTTKRYFRFAASSGPAVWVDGSQFKGIHLRSSAYVFVGF
jgi:hypothetical protein